MSDLCREFGISRKTGYKMLARFEEHGPRGLFDISRRPQRLARAMSPEVRELILGTKRAHPTWGPRKLRSWLEGAHPGVKLPVPSTIWGLLSREGLVTKRQRRRAVPSFKDPLRSALGANDLWCADYKGQFRLGNGSYCYPLTITDQYSRFLLGCEGFEAIETDTARSVFELLFENCGVPQAIRTDNGAPFASRGLHGLSRLSAWWVKLGIVHERIEPGHPEQNGRHERMHRTLKAETTRPASANLLQQQERFDAFVEEYNEERPHEALGQQPPRKYYKPSDRPMPTGELTYPMHDDVRCVDRGGHLRVMRGRSKSIFLSSALAGERIGIREREDGRLLLTFANLDLGHVAPTTMTFSPIEKEEHAQQAPEKKTTKVLPMSPS
jgi:transposase InsO family protein